MVWLSAVRLHICNTFRCFLIEVIAFPPGSKGRITVSSRVFQNASGSLLLQSSVCKVNSTGDNTEGPGALRRGKSDIDTVCPLFIECGPLLGKTESTGSAEGLCSA